MKTSINISILLLAFVSVFSSCSSDTATPGEVIEPIKSISVSNCKYGSDLSNRWRIGDEINAICLESKTSERIGETCVFTAMVNGINSSTFTTKSSNSPQKGERWIFWKGKSAKYDNASKRFDVNYPNDRFMSLQELYDNDFLIDTISIGDNVNLNFKSQSVVFQVKGLPEGVNKLSINGNKDWACTSFSKPSVSQQAKTEIEITSSTASSYGQTAYILLKPVYDTISDVELTISGYNGSNFVFNHLCGTGNIHSGDVINVALEDAVSIYERTPYNSKDYTKIDKFSNEFDGNTIDTENWENPFSSSFATWTFQSENTSQHDGKLFLTMKYNKHTRAVAGKTQNLYFESGMLRSKEKVGYGYYEARIKGAPVWPGTCTAFWLYTFPADCKNIMPRAENTVVYNEIDVVELQQVPSNIDLLSTNIHIWVLDKNLKNKQIKAGQYPSLGKSETIINGLNGGRNEFHTYAVENRPDSIVFYFDNKRIASKPNYFWHLNMYLTLSLGLRTPYEKYEGSDRYAVETTEAQALAAGFPCAMEVEYVRSWKRDYSKFPSLQKPFKESDFK